MISINFTLVVQIFHFLVLVWIMNRILIRPVLAHLKEKEENLAAEQTNVDGLVAEKDDRAQAYKAHLKAAHQKAAEERDKMLAQAKSEAAALRERSSEEGRKAMEKVRSEIQASLDEVRTAISAGENDMAEALAQAYLGRKS